MSYITDTKRFYNKPNKVVFHPYKEKIEVKIHDDEHPHNPHDHNKLKTEKKNLLKFELPY